MRPTKTLFILLWFIAFLSGSYGQSKPFSIATKELDDALIQGNVDSLLALTGPESIFMLDYQRTLQGPSHLKVYYSKLFKEHDVIAMERTGMETLTLGEYHIEIGTFTKSFVRISDKKNIIHTGKYWCIWKSVGADSELFAYMEGYHQEIPKEEYVVLDIGIDPKNNGTIELRAYAAFGEKAIREWDPELRMLLYEDDAIFYPFADTAKIGIKILDPYLRGYHQNDIKIDFIKGEPFAYRYLDGYVLQFSTFEVDWHFNEASGTNKGKGITLWKRQPDHSLKIYRKIGSHNDLKP